MEPALPLEIVQQPLKEIDRFVFPIWEWGVEGRGVKIKSMK